VDEVAGVVKKLAVNTPPVRSPSGVTPTRRPSVCVLIPVHNQARYLFRAVASAICQLEPQDELILVDDASTDIVDHAGLGPFLDRILWLRHPSRRGVSFSRNHGIIRSRADWIKPLDADDVLAPFALDVLRHTPIPDEVQLITGGCHRIHNNRYYDYLCANDETIRNIPRYNPTLPSAVFLRLQALLEVGIFDTRIDFEEDWDLWLKLHQRHGGQAFMIVEQPFCYYWIEEAERNDKKRQANIEGCSVREYLRQRYGADPK